MTLSLIAALLGVSVCCAQASVTPPRVTIKNGTYTGIKNSFFGQDMFLGMPFAQPPVGDLRLRAPLSVNTSWEGTRTANQYSSICPGYCTNTCDNAGYPQSENCLTVNVVRPSTVSEGSNVGVVQWVYGGGYQMGSSWDIRHNCSWFVQRSVEMNDPVVFVTFNYRAAAFGFLDSQEVRDEGVTNIGLLDMRLAMHWVQENIAAFGGDPTKVTIMGESAGAMAIAAHLTAFGGRDDGLFRAAILESGSPTTENFLDVNQTQPLYDAIVEKAGCANATDTLSCLRTVPYETFYAAANDSHQWQPTLDGTFLGPEYPTQALQEGKYVKVPLLMGSNTDECTSFAQYGIESTEQLAAALAANYPRLSNASIAHIIDLYPNIPALGCPYGSGDGLLPSGYLDKQSAAIFGDILMVSGIRFFAQVASQTQPVWKYRFNQIPINYTMAGVSLMHYVEVAYVYSNQLAVDANPLGTRPNDLALANLMTSMWISFVNNLDPNYSQVEGAPFWPSYSSLSSPKNLVFQDNWLGTSYVEFDNWREEGIAFINSLGPELQH
ncbi:alpha/beta-hydrolase [Calocera viscosa TUFC12733]|uniref:Carboxylic ester hydrolase n=1 Tax=Calocera viscosa (strain TUFC12733) TaxID=1330018 RepID=A0A167HRT3_CALVF|nr:alpha/beta-hydrolase [Calocera viscosa TUFC12733]